MNQGLPHIYIARHGETAWSLSGQHTGLTDLPLTEKGRENAQYLGARLQGMKFATVLTSPLQRAATTCELAGFATAAQTDPDLMEWNYGDYEGLRREEIVARQPGWLIFRDGCPGGESPAQVAARADRVLERLRGVRGDALIFSSGHFLRMLAARWLGLQFMAGNCFLLGTASLSIIGYGHDLTEPAIQLWNDTHHLGGEKG
jgi:broad specificity phosphatase PhoE